jgi:NADPH:quinone reductase-like Zn-dependent oxidoreductase
MRALLYASVGGPDVLRVGEVEDPSPGRGEVLICVRAASVGPGDCKLRAGLLQAHFSISFPKIPGRYGAGEVVALGPDVDAIRIGDRVAFAAAHDENGSCAEMIVRPRGKIASAPANVTFPEAAAVIHEGVCAVSALGSANVGAGSRLLVHGAAGAVGGACVQLARHLGAVVTATCRECNRDYVHALGAHFVIPFDREDFSRTMADQDVVIDTQGGEVHERSYRVLKRGGRLVYLNAAPIEDRGAGHGVIVMNAIIEDSHAALSRVCRLVETGVLKPRVAMVLPLAEGALAHRLVESGAVKRGRMILTME